MNLKYFSIIIPMIVSFFSKGWGDDLDISFRKAVMNDVRQNKWRLAVIPASLVTTVLTTVIGLVFLIHGTANWFLYDARAGEVSLVTGAVLAVIAVIAASLLMLNVGFIVRRVEAVQNTLLQAQQARPLQQLYQQIKEEQRMFLEAFQKRNQNKRRDYESDNISVV